MTSIVEGYQMAKSKSYMTLRDSNDKIIHNTRPDIKTGSKWSVSDVEFQLKQKDIVGVTQVDRR